MSSKVSKAVEQINLKLIEEKKTPMTDALKLSFSKTILDETGRLVSYEIIASYVKSLHLISSKIKEYLDMKLQEKLKELESVDNPILQRVLNDDKILGYLMEQLDPEFLMEVDCSNKEFDEYISTIEKNFPDKSHIVSACDVTGSDMLSNMFNDANHFGGTSDMIMTDCKYKKKSLKFTPRNLEDKLLIEHRIVVKDFKPLSCLSVEKAESFSVNHEAITFVSKNSISNMRRLIRCNLTTNYNNQISKPFRSYLGIDKGRNIITYIEEFQPKKSQKIGLSDSWLLLLQINQIDDAVGKKMLKAVVLLMNHSKQNKDVEFEIVYERILEGFTTEDLRKIKLKKSENNLAIVLFLNETLFVYFSIPSVRLEKKDKSSQIVPKITHHEVTLPIEDNEHVYEVDLCELNLNDELVKLYRVTNKDTLIYKFSLEPTPEITRFVTEDSKLKELSLKEIKSKIEAKSDLIYSMKHHLEISDPYRLYVFASTAKLKADQKKKTAQLYALYVNFFDTTGINREFTFSSWLHYGMNSKTPPKIFVQNTLPGLLDDRVKLSRFVWVVTASMVAVVFEITAYGNNKRDVELVAGPSKLEVGEIDRFRGLDMVYPLQKAGCYPGLVLVNSSTRQLQTVELVSTLEIEEEKNSQRGNLDQSNVVKLQL